MNNSISDFLKYNEGNPSEISNIFVQYASPQQANTVNNTTTQNESEYQKMSEIYQNKGIDLTLPETKKYEDWVSENKSNTFQDYSDWKKPKTKPKNTTNYSDNFDISIFTKSETANKYKLDNTPDSQSVNSLKLLKQKLLNPLESKFGNYQVSSAFRSKKVNEHVGGANDSQHTRGEAIDLKFEDNKAAFDYIKSSGMDFDQMIWEKGDNNQPAWIHLSYNPTGNNRKQILKTSDGKTYVPFN